MALILPQQSLLKLKKLREGSAFSKDEIEVLLSSHKQNYVKVCSKSGGDYYFGSTAWRYIPTSSRESCDDQLQYFLPNPEHIKCKFRG